MEIQIQIYNQVPNTLHLQRYLPLSADVCKLTKTAIHPGSIFPQGSKISHHPIPQKPTSTYSVGQGRHQSDYC